MSNNNINNMIIVTDAYGRQKTILTNYLPRTPKFFEDGHLEQLDGLLTYQFSTLASDPATVHLVAGNNVIVRNKDRKLVMFTIIRTREERRDGKYVRTVFAENAAVDDLYNHICDGEELRAVSVRNAATKILEGTGWQVGIVDDAGLQNVNLNEYPTALAALHMIRDQYGLELEFTVSFIGTKVRDRYVHLVKKRGSVTGKRFTYGKDLTGITREVDRSDLATAIIPIGKADENGKRLTIEAFQNIHEEYVSPKGQKWVGDERAMQLYGKDGKHLFKRLDLSGVDNEYELMKRAVEELRRVKQPRVTYEISCLLLEALSGYEHEKVRLGDTILVKDTMFDPVLAVKARVIAIYRSYTNPSKDYVVLGEFVPLVIDKNKQIQAIQDTINQNMTKWEQGGEVVLKSPNEPIKSKRTPDMLWLDTSAQPNIMKRWDAENNRWVNASVTTPQEIGAETPEGAQKKADKAEGTAIAEAAEDAAIKAKKAEEKAIEVAEEMDESVKIELKSYVEGLTEEVEAELKKHADKKAEDAELNAKLFAEGYAEKEWHYGEMPPEDLKQIWFDMSSTPNKIRKYNEKTKQWEAASPTSPKDIGAADQKEVIDAANKARDAAIQEAKTEANKAKDAAIAEAKELDRMLKTEAERLSQQAQKEANEHTNSVTKQVEEALKKDSQDKANAAEKNAVDKSLQNARTEAENARKKAEENAKAEADRLAKAEAKKAQDAAAADAKAKADAARKAAEDKAAKELADRIAGLSNVGRNLLLGTKGVTHVVKDGENKNHTYFKFVDNAIKDIQGKPITASLKISGKVASIGNTNPWIGLEVRVDYVDGTSQYISARVEKDIKPNVEYNRSQFAGTGVIFDKPLKSLSAYALARDFKGGTITLEEFKVGIGTMATDYDQPREEELQEVRDTIGSASGQNLALNSAAKLGWIGWSATQTGVNDKWTIGTTGALNGFTHVFRLVNKQTSTAENFLINTIPVANARILGKKVQFGGWVYTESMTTGGIRFYARFRGKNAAGAEVLKYANAGAANDIRGKHWQWVTFEFDDWAGMESLDEVRITANCLKGSNGEACITGVMMKVSEVSSQWTPSPLDFEELASDAGVLTKGTLAAERLYGQTIDGNKANFVNLNASNISTGTLSAERLEFGGRARDIAENRPVTYTGGNGFSINGGMTARYNGAGSSRADKFPCTMSLDFGTVIGECVRIQWTSYYSNDARYAARSYKLETSLDGTNWTTWADVTNNTNPIVSYGVAGNGQVRYVRLTVRAPQEGQTSVNVANFEVHSVQAGTIVTGDSILTGRIDATKVNVDNLNAGNIKSGTIHADRIGANSINASKIVAGAINGNHIAANAITTDKLHVLAKSLVANTSLTGNDSLGWRVGKHATSTSLLRGSENMGDVLVHAFTTAEHETPTTYDSLMFEVDPNQTYKFSIGMFLDKNTRNSSQYFGLKAYDKNGKELPMQPLNPTTGALSGTPRTNPYFWSGKEVSGSWRYMEGYAVSSQAGANEAPQGRNIQSSYQMHPATKTLLMRFYSGYYPTVKNAAMEVLWHSPSVTSVDSGTIIAERITAGVLDANKVNVTNLKANNITSGTMTADRINGGTINAANTNIINLKAGNITSGTINAATIDITNMKAQNITSGILHADRIGAKSISVDKMIIGDTTNLCPNPDFEQEGGWFGTVTRIDSSNASVPTGAPTKFVGRQTQRDGKGSDMFAVKQGDQFYISGYVASKNSNHGATIGIYFFNKDGGAVAAMNSGYKTKQNGQWQFHEGWITAPANAVKAYVWTQINEFKDFGEWFFTKIEVRRRMTGHLIVDGAISAQRLAANAVTADKIEANAVNASKIAAGSVTAEKVAANAITADKIAANAVNAGKIAAGSITTDKIAAAGITADKITSGILDANRVQVRNLNASVITAGTMSADRITGGTINANNTNIINLKAQNIASGTINADNVAISNGRVTINKDGVTVTEANFLVKDANTGLTHSVSPASNLLNDHSFELLRADSNSNFWAQNYRKIDRSFVDNGYDGWAIVGDPYIADLYTGDGDENCKLFGRKSVIVNTANYVWQDIAVKANKKYSISFHCARPLGTPANEVGSPQVQVEYMKDSSVIASEVKTFAIPPNPVGTWVRYGFTVTANSGLNGRNNIIRLRFRTNNHWYLLIDGMQAVENDTPVAYNAEDSLFLMSNNRLSPVSMTLRNLMMRGNTRIEGGGLSIAGQNINGVGLEMSEILRVWNKPIEARNTHVAAHGYQCIASRPAGVDRMIWVGWHDQAGNAIYVYIGGSWKVAVRL
ncbi:phage tail spike protein [Bacillus thuringiensis]|uniref:phage tail spike protein n=1 Tax=Bacillus thuringiensis TaxID=1428 RepID=UPI00211D3DC0|nr:phage tail spike protein [Bacillus thuringiensis]